MADEVWAAREALRTKIDLLICFLRKQCTQEEYEAACKQVDEMFINYVKED